MLTPEELEAIFGVKFKKVGRVYQALCPFHAEKTPSFTYYPNTNTAFCFGCGVYINLDKYLTPEQKVKAKRKAKINLKNFILEQTRKDFWYFINTLLANIIETEEDLEKYGQYYHWQWYPEKHVKVPSVKIEPLDWNTAVSRIIRNKWILENENIENVLSIAYFSFLALNKLIYGRRQENGNSSRPTRPKV